jgi:hypothetical protein
VVYCGTKFENGSCLDDQSPVAELPMFAISFLPRTVANLRNNLFRGPPLRKIDSSWYAEGEFRQFALKGCLTCDNEREKLYSYVKDIAKMYLSMLGIRKLIKLDTVLLGQIRILERAISYGSLLLQIRRT